MRSEGVTSAEAVRAAGLLGPFEELAVDRAVAERAGRIRREFSLRVPDALTAATAVEHALTRNVHDFRVVRGLRLRTRR